MALQRVLTLSDLPFTQSAQEGNPSGIVPSLPATGSIGNMQYAAATAGAAGNSISITHQLAEFLIPSVPAAPTFNGTLHTVGSGGDFATLGAAIASLSVQNGDRLQLIGATITESALVNVNKQVEIFSEEDTTVQRSSTSAVITISVGSVYVHDFTIVNAQQASTDAGGQGCCVNTDTMNRNAVEGVTGVRIENMTFVHPKVGVFVSGTGWSVLNCTFEPNANSQTAGTTLRSVFLYGTVANCFIVGNTIGTSTDVSRSTGIFLDVRNDGIAPNYASGYKGSLIIRDNAMSLNGSGSPRSYIDATGFFRQPGPASTNGNLGEFSLYVVNNDFALDYASSPCVFFGRAGVSTFGFFNTLLVQNNSFGKRTTGEEKGALFFTNGGNASMGTFGGDFYASNNTITAATLAANTSIMAVAPLLLMVRDSTYLAPSPLLTPAEPVGSFAVNVVGNAVTVSVPPNNPATSLASSLNADGSFSALVAATAANGSNASTTGTVTLSGGQG